MRKLILICAIAALAYAAVLDRPTMIVADRSAVMPQFSGLAANKGGGAGGPAAPGLPSQGGGGSGGPAIITYAVGGGGGPARTTTDPGIINGGPFCTSTPLAGSPGTMTYACFSPVSGGGWVETNEGGIRGLSR